MWKIFCACHRKNSLHNYTSNACNYLRNIWQSRFACMHVCVCVVCHCHVCRSLSMVWSTQQRHILSSGHDVDFKLLTMESDQLVTDVLPTLNGMNKGICIQCMQHGNTQLCCMVTTNYKLLNQSYKLQTTQA